MRATGAGSQSSPIFIDDSEDEVIQELCDISVESYSNPTPHAPRSPVSPDYSNSYAFPVERTSYRHTNYEMNNYQQGGQESQGKRAQKRKRAEIEQRNVSFAGPSHPTQPVPSLDARLSNKKAKKRRRKLEAQSRHHIQPNSANFFSKHEHAPLPPPHQWPVDSMAYNSDNFVPPPFAYEDRLSYSAQAPQSYHHQHYYSDNTDSVAASTSSWVSSMALAAAEPPIPEPMQPWESYPRLPEWHPPPLSPPPIPPLPVEPLSKPPPIPILHPRPTPVAKKAKHNVPEPIPAPLPAPVAPVALPKPAPAAPIGMQPDQDPSSKHGLFQIPASTSSSGTTPAEPYIPNPARTLVVEQLPKTHRTKDFVNTWSKSACGAYPVHVIVDAPAAKALVEFATAELARKAWSSPKLGANLAGLKTHQLKGKPREDLIKAWWYRVVGVGAGAGVGEIEEGEIEGDATEKEVEVPAKKETKKEKKARLARERLAKQQNLLKAATKVPAVEAPDEHEPTPSTSYVAQPLQDDTVASIPALPPSAVPPALVHPLPYHLPPPSYAFAHIPPSAPLHTAPTPYLPPQPPPVPTYAATHISPPAPPLTRTPLPPQSALDTHWRPKHELPKKPEKPPLGTSTAVNGSISSQTAPQAPPRSLQESPRDVGYPPADDDMDVEVDMEIDSPQTSRRALYDVTVPPFVEMEIEAELPLPRSPSPIPADLSGPSATLTVEAVTSVVSRTASLSTLPQFDVLSSSVTPPLPVASPSPSVTPSLAPSEPKAMKNAPKGPSYAKRSLLARQKELEERIAKSKMEIARLNAGSVPPTPPVPTTPPPDTTSANLFNGSLELKQAMEDRLRSLVMKSQKNKTRSLLSPPPSTTSPVDSLHPPISASPTPSSSVPAVSPVLSATPVSTIAAHAFSLDDLAVSFITETIQTYKALPPPVPASTSALKPPSRINTKLELAAKQKRLEQQITESKVLMEQLAQAKTKQDKDRILAAMRERSRMMEEEDKTSQSPVSTTTTTFASAASTTIKHSQYGADQPPSQYGADQPPQAGVMRWPDSHHDAGVLIVSDDEGDSDSEDDDDWA